MSNRSSCSATHRVTQVAFTVMMGLLCIISNGWAQPVEPGVRAVVTRATASVTVDGNLAEFADAVCTPIEYFNADSKNRPAQFFYLWDEEAFYVGLRTLDTKMFSPIDPLWEGDAVEWYFDTRRDKSFRNQQWGSGSVHCFFTPLKLAELNPRFCLRPGYLDAIPQTGVQVAARTWAHGLEVEFKLPWVNFPNFKAQAGEVIGIDAELSYSDGGPRSFRSFVFGSPLSVQQPGNLARVQLVDKFQTAHWRAAGPVMMPIRIDTPWSQNGVPHVVARIAIPPQRHEQIGRITFQVVDLAGTPLGSFAATQETTLQAEHHFVTRSARWPADLAAPGTYTAYAIVYDNAGQELTRVAPRMVSVNSVLGY